MYFATEDKTIQKMSDEMTEKNEKLIADFKKMPFWKRWFIGEEDLKKEIYQNYINCEKNATLRMEIMREKNNNLLKTICQK